MSEKSLSQSVAEAADFLHDVYTDTQAMLVSLEAELKRAKWEPIAKKITEPNLNATLQGEWMLWWFYRMYVQQGSGDKFRRLILVSGSFGAEPGGNATLTGAAVRFTRATTYDEVWNAWDKPLSAILVSRDCRGTVILTPKECKEFILHASAVAAVAFPLCELNSEQAVRTQLVQPLLAAEKALGEKP